MFLGAFFEKSAFSRRFLSNLKISASQPAGNEALTKDGKTRHFIDTDDFTSGASCGYSMCNVLWISMMSAKCAILVPCQNLVTYNASVNFFPRDMVGLHSMKSVRANSWKVCGGNRPEGPSISAALPPSFSTLARQACANLWESDSPGRRVRSPAEHIPRCSCRADRISEHSRLFESIRGSKRNPLISKKGLLQVVDFHDSFRYFQHPFKSAQSKNR